MANGTLTQYARFFQEEEELTRLRRRYAAMLAYLQPQMSQVNNMSPNELARFVDRLTQFTRLGAQIILIAEQRHNPFVRPNP